MEPETLLLALLAEQELQSSSLTSLLLDRFDELDSWRDADARDFSADVRRLVEAAQVDMASLTSAYLAEQIAELTGSGVDLLGVRPQDVVDLRNGTTTEQVYERPFKEIWKQLHEGQSLDNAVAAGRRRLESTAKTDLQLAKRQAAHDHLTKSRSAGRVVGFRRVLTGLENCGLCIVASTQRYHKADLLPIHNSCDCAIAAIVGEQDPGQSINSMMLTDDATLSGMNALGNPVYEEDRLRDLGDLLNSAHDAIADTFGASYRDARTIDYRKVTIEFNQAELGPVLEVRRHKLK